MSAVAVQDLVTSLPSLYDLLPKWECVAPPNPAEDPTHVDGAFVQLIGGDPELLRRAMVDFQARTATSYATPEIVSVAGIKQPTPASVSATTSGNACSSVGLSVRAFMRDGKGFERDRAGRLSTITAGGDGTVPHFSASLDEHAHKSVQRLQHNQLAFAAEGLAVASHFVSNSDEPKFLAAPSDLGIAVPQVAPIGRPTDIEVTGVDAAALVRIKIRNQHGQVEKLSAIETKDGRICARVENREEGIYIVQVDDGHGTPLEASYVVLSE